MCAVAMASEGMVAQARAVGGEDVSAEMSAPPNVEDLRPAGSTGPMVASRAPMRGGELGGPMTITSTRGLLNLPESEFIYMAGPTDRPWQHFVNRWQAIFSQLDKVFGAGPQGQQFFAIDIGSCSGFFALQAAHAFPRAEVVGVEGSVGIGNGTMGMEGTSRQILCTPAVQTHLKWIGKLGMQNCLVAPEVWDYAYVCDLAARGAPVCDVLFLLSVIHHIDGVSQEQYAQKGLSRVEGTVDLIAKLLTIAPRHMIELPDRPWLEWVYNVYPTQRALLDAAVKRTGDRWVFKGPLLESDWFGKRQLWMLELEGAPCSLCSQSEGLFPQLFGPEEAAGILQPIQRHMAPTSDPRGVQAGDTYARNPIEEPQLPAVTCSDAIGQSLLDTPTALLAAHLSLREAVAEAEDLLREVRSSGLGGARAGGRGQLLPGAGRGSAMKDAARANNGYAPQPGQAGSSLGAVPPASEGAVASSSQGVV